MNRRFAAQVFLFTIFLLSASISIAISSGKPVAKLKATANPIVNSLPFTWDAKSFPTFVTCLCRDKFGCVWVGTENEGVLRFNSSNLNNAVLTGIIPNNLWPRPSATGDRIPSGWSRIKSKDIFGPDNSVYALACDHAGRIWAGTLRNGVVVFNGEEWRKYGPMDGLLGTRVFAIAISPKDNDVWIATDAGLCRFSERYPKIHPELAIPHTTWTNYTRTQGLPSDQANALAFSKDGEIYVGTQCDGIAIGSPKDGFHTWRVVGAPEQMPHKPAGEGLPSPLINALLVSKSGTIYAGTNCGLAWSEDSGKSWQYLRGADWRERVEGLYKGPKPEDAKHPGDLLMEDYVTSLAEDGKGQLWIGHRRKGAEIKNEKNLWRQQEETKPPYVTSILSGVDGTLLGTYGDGLYPLDFHPVTNLPSIQNGKVYEPPASPIPADPPEIAQIQEMQKRLDANKDAAKAGDVFFLGQDWQTQGDWLCRYGKVFGMLWAIEAPYNDEYISTPVGIFDIYGEIGPHHVKDDAIKHWLLWLDTNNPGTLFAPHWARRRQGDVDDHGETYPYSWEGPDLWFTVKVPEGAHRVSFYFFNKDGHDWDNRYRDYLVEWRKYIALGSEDPVQRRGLTPPQPKGSLADLDAALKEPVLAHARVRDFWGGVYERFSVVGPATYLVRVSRNGSLNTICTGTFIDSLTGEWTSLLEMASMPGIAYGYDIDDAYEHLPVAARTKDIEAARTLEKKCREQAGERIYAYERQNMMVQSTRLIKSYGDLKYDTLLSSYRFQTPFWDYDDRDIFNSVMNMVIDYWKVKIPSWAK